MTKTINGFGVLRSVLERAREKAGCSGAFLSENRHDP
jgi:hypothetical protein